YICKGNIMKMKRKERVSTVEVGPGVCRPSGGSEESDSLPKAQTSKRSAESPPSVLSSKTLSFRAEQSSVLLPVGLQVGTSKNRGGEDAGEWKERPYLFLGSKFVALHMKYTMTPSTNKAETMGQFWMVPT
ncbi:hypothetical protein P4O66_012628, partial [Electrophorus voltai]